MKKNQLVKIVSVSALALGALGGVALNANPVHAATSVGTIKNPDSTSAVYVYDGPNGNLVKTRTLANGSQWKIMKTVKVSGHGTWYELGTGVWINDYMFQVTSSTSTASTTATTATTTSTTTANVGTIKNPSSNYGVYVYDAANGNLVKSRTLANGSQWKIMKTVKVSGHGTWYELGTGVWVNEYVFKVGTTTTTATSKVVTTSATAAVYNAANGTATGQTLKSGTAWKYDSIQDVDGMQWYEVGKNQWIKASTTTAGNHSTTAATANIAVTDVYGASVYDAPEGSVVKTLASGTSWKVSAAKTVNGVVWYEVGKNMWISANAVTAASQANITVTGATTSTTATATTSNTKVVTLTEAAALYDAANGTVTGRVLPAGSSWKVSQTTTADGKTWGLVGANEWLDLSLGTVK